MNAQYCLDSMQKVIACTENSVFSFFKCKFDIALHFSESVLKIDGKACLGQIHLCKLCRNFCLKQVVIGQKPVI